MQKIFGLLLLSAAIVPGMAAAPALAADTELVSVNRAGRASAGLSTGSTVSGNGRFVAFGSSGTDLVTGPVNGFGNVFVRDRQTDTTVLVSAPRKGAAVEPGGGSGAPRISRAGRFVAFESNADNLVTGGGNDRLDVFHRDVQAGTTTLVSVGRGGAASDDQSNIADISDDGRLVAFSSFASNLVAGDSNGQVDLFVRDLDTGRTLRESVGPGGRQANGSAGPAALSGDGRYLAFTSEATNLVAGDTNGRNDVFLRDRRSGTTSRISVRQGGAQADGASSFPAISRDGRFAAFSSIASNLVAGPRPAAFDAFLLDRSSGEIIRISAAGGGGSELVTAISRNGRFVVYQSDGSNQVPNDTNGLKDVFVYDREDGKTRRVSVAASGAQGTCPVSQCSRDGGSTSYQHAISDDGEVVAFASISANLDPQVRDTNRTDDAFVRIR